MMQSRPLSIGPLLVACVLGLANAEVACGVEMVGCQTHAVENNDPPYTVVVAYPFGRAAAFPPEDIPFEYVDQIGHFSVRPGQQGTMVVPKGFVMPALIELAHEVNRKVIVGVGGTNSHSAFAPMVADPNARASFVRNLTGFVVDQGYDGVNIDWEFPQSPVDRQNLNALMRELRQSLEATGRHLTLSISVTSNEGRGQWIDVDSITPLVDQYVVMTFGYYGPWGSMSGHHAPLYAPARAIRDTRSVDQSLRYWVETRGVPQSKILMGVASFGIWFDSEGLGQPFTETQKADYRDIASLIGHGYRRHWDGTAQVPYLTQDGGPGLWSYDDPQSIRAKRDYVLANGLAGMAVWDVTMDVVAGEHELLRAIAYEGLAYRIYIPLLQVRR